MKIPHAIGKDKYNFYGTKNVLFNCEKYTSDNYPIQLGGISAHSSISVKIPTYHS